MPSIALSDVNIQLWIVYMVRHALQFVPWKGYKAVARDLKCIYQSATESEASLELNRFNECRSIRNTTYMAGGSLSITRVAE